MLGIKINKPVITQEECDAYSKVAEWCNENDAHIEDKGDYYEVVANPKPTKEELEARRIASMQPTLEERLEAMEEMLIALGEEE